MYGANPCSEGEVNDHPGKGPSGGCTSATFLAWLIPAVENNMTVGNISTHGVISGEAHTNGCAGECPRACNLGVTVAAEGAGDYRREHTIGGCAAASGCIGCNPVVGTSGGAVHARNKEGDPDHHRNTETAESLSTEDSMICKESYESTCKYHYPIGSYSVSKTSDNRNKHADEPT